MKICHIGMSIVIAAAMTSRPGSGAEAGAKAAAEAGNAFALDLFAKLSSKRDNLFFSPHSVHVALAMALAGARGDTAAEMGKVLHLPADGSPGTFESLLAHLNEAGGEKDAPAFRLEVANALWGQKGYAFSQEYIDIVRARFGGELTDVDFRKAAEAARRTINGWVEKRTEKRIVDLIPPGLLDADTRLVLTNAIYMKSAWEEQFKVGATADLPFYLEGRKSTVKAPLMHRTGHYLHRAGKGFAAVEIPYAEGRLSMLVLLPDNANGLPTIEKDLPKAIADLKDMGERRVDLWLPRFKLASEVPMTETLRALGMTKAMAPGADFSGIEPRKELYISDVLHKAFVDVNEEGTEAAAATAVVMRLGAAPAEEKPVVFKADRPFLFLIRHRDTGAILFLGRVLDPTAKG
jgi:serpin B